MLKVLLLLSLSLILHAKNPTILGIGSPCIDTLIHVPDECVLQLFGKKGGSSSLSATEYSTFSQRFHASSARHTAGGSCCNTLTGLAQLGNSCALAGRIGSDEAGRHVLDHILSAGIHPKLVASSTPTARVLCFITGDHERTLKCYLGASGEFRSSDLLADDFEGVKLVHIEGYTLYNGSLCEQAMQIAKAKGAKVSLDLGSHQLVARFRSDLLKLIPKYVDILFGNCEEYKALTGLEPQEAGLAMQKLCKIAVVLAGPEGCFVGANSSVIHDRAKSIQPVDTTGAGDNFIAGFLHGYLLDRSLEECAAFGNLLGGTVVESIGAAIPKDKWDKIRSELNADVVLTKN